MGKKKEKAVKTTKSGIAFKDSIKTKLIAIMMLVAAVPLIIAIIVSYNTSTPKAKSDALDLLASKVATIEKEYSSVINQNITALQTFAAAHSTIEYVENYGAEDAKITDEDMWAEFDKMNENIDDGNTSIAMCDPTGQQILRSDRKEGSSIGDRDYFQECISTGKPVVSNIVVAKTTGNRVTNIIVPIYNREGISTTHASPLIIHIHHSFKKLIPI